jgi:hypothetical protein
MIELRQQLSEVFKAPVFAVEPLTGADWGVKATFEEPFDLKTALQSVYLPRARKIWFYSADLCALVDRVGVLVLENATSTVSDKFQVTNGKTDGGALLQDPPHRDIAPTLHAGAVSVLFQREAVARQAPTYYSTIDKIKQAIGELDRDGLSDDVCAALDRMVSKDFTFTVIGEELSVRHAIIRTMPEFTERVFERIDPAHKIAVHWGSAGAPSQIAIHSNALPFIHARPTSMDTDCHMLGINIKPSLMNTAGPVLAHDGPY